MSDRGVSETLGFVLVFALVTGTIGIVYATGVSGLHDAQEAEGLRNVERAFDVLADNLADLHERGAPSRATEVRLAGGSVGTGEPVTVEVYAEAESDPLDNATYAITLEPIVYEGEDGSALVYESGAVLREESGGAVMLTEPDWINGTNRSVIPLVNTFGAGGGVGGDGAVLIVAQRDSRTLPTSFAPSDGGRAHVNVTVTSPRAEAWKRFFEEQGFEAFDDSLDDDTVTYGFETERLYVPETAVEVTFDR